MNNRILIVMSPLLIAGLTLLFAFRPAAPASGGYAVGDYATDFSLKNVDGNMVSLSDWKDVNGFIVIFTCNHCPYSVAYEDRILALDAAYRERGWPVVAINPNDVARVPGDSYEGMVERAAEKSFTFPYLRDETQEIAAAYGATRTPHVFLLERQKKDKLRVAYIGAIDDSAMDPDAVEERYVENAIAALEDGKAPEPSLVKAIGCTIKWKK